VSGEPHHVSAFRTVTDDPIERDLLAIENERLHREVTTLRAALKAAGRVLGPYLKVPESTK
jgi:hypothetical protein